MATVALRFVSNPLYKNPLLKKKSIVSDTVALFCGFLKGKNRLLARRKNSKVIN